MIPIEARKFSLANKKSLKNVKNGFWISAHSTLMKQYGCDFCSWRTSKLCPHGLVDKERHANRICSERILWVQELFARMGSKAKMVQVDEAIKAQLVTDNMLAEYGATGNIHTDFHKIQRNLMTHLDKMRRQDEGIKLQGEIHHSIDKFREIVDIQAKRIEDDKPDNKNEPRASEQEV